VHYTKEGIAAMFYQNEKAHMCAIVSCSTCTHLFGDDEEENITEPEPQPEPETEPISHPSHTDQCASRGRHGSRFSTTMHSINKHGNFGGVQGKAGLQVKK